MTNEPRAETHPFWGCSVLRSQAEVDYCKQAVRRLELRYCVDDEKNWDCLKALAFVQHFGGPDSIIADMGCSDYGRFLFWLKAFGYTHLFGCDRIFKKPFTRLGIHFSPQNIEKTSFPADCFDFISCLSVIEHGVHLDRFFFECKRLVRPGGFLLLSTDYWPESVTDGSLFDELYQCPVKVFNRKDVESLLRLAEHHGFTVVGDLDLSCGEKAVYWPKMNLRFTFLFLALRLTK